MSHETDSKEMFECSLSEHLRVVGELRQQRSELVSIAQLMSAALLGGRKILWCGNGGSAADSQHLAAELVGRFRRERRGFSSIALTTDSSILTSIANDYGYRCIFARQVEAIGQEGDVLVGISTSGNSQNVVGAVETARSMGLTTVALTGQGGGKLAQIADHLLAVPSDDTARIQEAHILVGHVLCDLIEDRFIRFSQATSKLTAD